MSVFIEFKKINSKNSQKLDDSSFWPVCQERSSFHQGTSLRRGGKGWRARKFFKERRGRMARIFLDARKFLVSRKFLEIRMAIKELP